MGSQENEEASQENEEASQENEETSQKSEGKPEKKAKKVSRFNLQGDPTYGRERLKDLALALGWRNGKHTASVMNRALTFKVRKLPTGIFAMDWLTHGGIPLDRVTRISGPKNVCKTTTLLKLLANSQSYCRMCKTPIVISPYDGTKNCECPKVRYKLENTAVLEYLEYHHAYEIIMGRLPEIVKKDNKGLYVEAKKKKFHFEETYRCAPMQSVFVETEHKLDVKWAETNGVDTNLVVAVGSDWAESTIDTVETLLYSGEVDLVFVDTLSMLVPREKIEKRMERAPRVALGAATKQRFIEKIIAAQYSGGLINDNPVTIVVASQIRTKGIGSGRAYQGVSDGNMMDHIVTLDMRFRLARYKWIHSEYASYGEYEFTVDKNHAGGSSGVTGNYKMWLDPKGPRNIGDTDDADKVIHYARQGELIIGGSGKYRICSPYLKEETTFKTIGAVGCFLSENPTVYRDLRRRVLEYVLDIRTPVPEKEKGKE